MRTYQGHRFGAVLIVVALLVAVGCTDDDSGSEGGQPEGTVVGESTNGYEATIERTDDGVPHITGESVADVAFGQGWASGEDRACDLADQVVKIRGERAKWFGAGEEDANINSDLAWRAVGLQERAATDWEQAAPEVRELITAYVDGWNAHLDATGAENLSDWCAGEPWVQQLAPVDVYTYARSIALQASTGQLLQYIATAEPPTGTDSPTTSEAALGLLDGPVASNGWAIGADRSTNGQGMLVANPHFPWEGELRFWEVHLTIPGEVDIYGVQLSGLPGIGIGFTEDFGWTHTVSAGNRFTAYRLDLVPGEPTTYLYGGEQREMTPTEITLDVKGDDGSTEQITRTMWSSHYGPVINFPGFGWTDAATITYRDANIDNDEFIEQYLGMMRAKSLDEFIDVHERVTGVPLFNTVAVSADGRAWYADTSATPNLSGEALAAYQQSVASDPIVKVAADNRAVLLDGSDPLFEWVDAPGARDPGLVPFADMPAVERSDYVFNANDSFWMPHAVDMLDGDYSPLHGLQDTARSPRTRENATVLGDVSATGPAGDDGSFTLDELAAATVQNRGYTSRALKDAVVQRCQGAAPVAVTPLTDEDGVELLPAGTVDLTNACSVLADWDGVYDVDRAGPPIWREFITRFPTEALANAGVLWAEPFDPSRPVETPGGLAPAAPGAPDPVLENLARAVQTLDKAGVAVDAELGTVQFANRNGTIVPIHGGDNRDGTTNIIGWGRGWSILDPELMALDRQPVVTRSSLAETETADGESLTGYYVNNGTSFLMALSYGPEGPQAKAFLTYGNDADRSASVYLDSTERFSQKNWRDVAFTDDQIDGALVDTKTVRG